MAETKYPVNCRAERLANIILCGSVLSVYPEAKELARLVLAGKISHAGPRTTEGAELVRKERLRQIDVEGCTPDGDDHYKMGELANGAIAYINSDAKWWPKSWEEIPYKPKSRIEDLIRGAALVVAEIDRLVRIKRQAGIEHGAIGPGFNVIVDSKNAVVAEKLQNKLSELVRQAYKDDLARLEDELGRLLAAGYKQDEIEIVERNGQRWAAVKAGSAHHVQYPGV